MSTAKGHLKVGLVTPYAMTSRWGVNRHVLGLAGAMERMGHEVCVIAPAEERNGVRSARQRARLTRWAARSGSTLSTPSPGEEAEAVRVLKVPGTFRLPYSESIANLALPKDVTDRLDAMLARERLDILHLHEPYPPGLSFAALRLARCPVVATFHTAGERFLSFQLLRSVVERFFSRLDVRLCTSQNTRRIVSGCFPGDYRVINGGVDTELFRPGEGKAPAAEPLVMYAAWGEPRKALALLFRSMRLLPEDLPPFQLAIVAGETLLRGGRLSIPRRLRGRVSFTGYAGGGDLPGFYARSQVLCAPYARPSQSTAALEAMASANAMLLPGQGGIRELMREGTDGILLDHPYSYNLAAGILDLLDNPETRLAMGRSAAERARYLSWGRTAAGVEDAYHEANQRRRRRPLHKAMEPSGAGDKILADLHTHTSYSPDCLTTPEQLLAACAECGIEAVAITDHNTVAGGLEAARIAPPGMHVIIGEEIKTESGEIIGLYLEEEIPRGLTAEETIARIKQQGGLVYVPHPFDPMHLTPTYEMLARNAADIDIIEVYNPRITFSSFNEKARRLARKYDIPGGAGSDCHVVEGVGTAMLSLSRFEGPLELLASLRRADIIRSTKSPLYLHSMKLLKNSRQAGSRSAG